jgi:hypothetical protein
MRPEPRTLERKAQRRRRRKAKQALHPEPVEQPAKPERRPHLPQRGPLPKG